MNNFLKRLGVFFLSTPFILLFFYTSVMAYEPQHKSYSEKSYYNDGTYEYSIGLCILMDNEASGGSANNLSAAKPQTQNYDAPGHHVSIDVYRDMWTSISPYGKLPYDGWTYYDCVWSSQSVLNKYGYDVGWYNQYCSNIDTLDYNKFRVDGIQDGGSAIYLGNGGVYNRYRRCAIVIFRRPLPKAYIGNNYINDDGSKVYANGTTLWKKSGDIEFRTWGYDYYNVNNQNVQYTGGIRGFYMGVASKSKNFLIKTDRNQSSTYASPQKSNGNSAINGKPYTYSYKNVDKYTNNSMTTVSMSGSKKHSTSMQYASYTGKFNIKLDNNDSYKFYSDVYDKWSRRGIDTGTNGTSLYTEAITSGTKLFEGFHWGWDGTTVYKQLSIDDNPPVISGIPSAAWTKNSVPINLSATDSGCGVDYIVLKEGNSKLASGTNSLSYTLKSAGKHTFTAYSGDKLENINTQTFNVNIDQVAPIGKTYGFSKISNTQFKVYATNVVDTCENKTTGSGVKTIKADVWVNYNGTGVKAKKTYTLTNEGNGTYSAVINISNHNNYDSWYYGSMTLTDNVGNTRTVPLNRFDLIKTNLKATEIKVFDISGNEVNKLIQNVKYNAKVKFSNNGEKDIKNFYVGVYSGSTFLSQTYYNKTIAAGTSDTVNIPFSVSERGTVNLVGFVDNTNIIIETDETDNKVTRPYLSQRVNIKATDIKIFDKDKKNEQAALQQNGNYVARIYYLNDGDVDLNDIHVGLYDNDEKIGAGMITSVKYSLGHNVGYIDIPFISRNRGVRTFTGILDDGNYIIESDETDNETSKDLASNRTNIKANSIKIYNPKEKKYVKQLIENQYYEAHINIENDGDLDISKFDLSLNQDGAMIKAQTITSSENSKYGLVINEKMTVKVPFKATGRTLKGTEFEGFADYNDKIVESDETDNKVKTPKPYDNEPVIPNGNTDIDKEPDDFHYDGEDDTTPITIIKLDLVAKYIDFVLPSSDEVQTELFADSQYRAKIKFSNESDVGWDMLDLLDKSFYVSLYEDDKLVDKQLIKNIGKNQIATIYFNYKPTAENVGSRKFKMVVDDGDKIPESNEGNNIKLNQKLISLSRLLDYKINNIINPPTEYVFPIFRDGMPADMKSGYKLTVGIISVGKFDRITVHFTDTMGRDLGVHQMTKKTVDSESSSAEWELDYITELDTDIGTILISDVIGYDDNNGRTYKYNTETDWNGDTVKFIGSALSDITIQRRY